jgi:hypothetical protein
MSKVITNLFSFLINLVLIGIIATAVMDLWGLVLYFTLGISVDWSLVGRLVGNMLEGNFFLYGLENAPAIQHENAIGWFAHYCTGLFYSFCFLLFSYKIMGKKPCFIYALIVSFAFMVVPFLFYQPEVGMGYFAAHASDPNLARLLTVSVHFSFGVGLYLGYRILKHFKLRIPFSKADE